MATWTSISNLKLPSSILLYSTLDATKYFILNGQSLTWLQPNDNGIVFMKVYKGLDNLQAMINIGHIDRIVLFGRLIVLSNPISSWEHFRELWFKHVMHNSRFKSSSAMVTLLASINRHPIYHYSIICSCRRKMNFLKCTSLSLAIRW